ncbi:MAG: hypothetical protein PHF86_13675 [Candidatus Nanoarchaeia archaeon]|nr:hypothetical protein [Candidatus Nanoarchaeia archaeon]
MEVILNSLNIDITLEQKYNELERLVNEDIEDYIFIYDSEGNKRSSKKAILHLDKNADKLIELEYLPKEDYWKNIEKIKITINPRAYETISFEGPIISGMPETKLNVLINPPIYESYEKK